MPNAPKINTMTASISLRGVRVHNLRGVDADIPLGRLTVVTGVSGAGKSSLVFDTLYAEAQRRFLQGLSPFTRQLLERFDRPEADFIGSVPPAVAVTGNPVPKNPRATVGTLTEIDDYLRLLFTRDATLVCGKCDRIVKAHSPKDVATLVESWPAGRRFSVAFPAVPGPDPSAWALLLQEEGFVRIRIDGEVFKLGESPLPELTASSKVVVLVDRLESGKFAAQRLIDSVETAFARGSGRLAILTDDEDLLFDTRLICPGCETLYPAPEPHLFSSRDPLGACPTCHGTGVTGESDDPCIACHGNRLNDQALCYRLSNKTIADLSSMTLLDLADSLGLTTLRDPAPSGNEPDALVDPIRRRLNFLNAVDLGHLSLDRRAASLSFGEARRLRLATVLGSGLAGALYMFEEPTVGLHPRDCTRLIQEISKLKDAGNTVVVIEHDPDVILAADHVIDLGPDAGEEGGRLLYQGPPSGLADCSESLTGPWLDPCAEETAVHRRPCKQGSFRIQGARLHNLQNLTVDFPLGVLCVVTGVSGAGKSTLVEETLYPAVARLKHKKVPANTQSERITLSGAGQIGDVVLMDQEPLLRSTRSNPATFLKIFDDVRDLFADSSEARIRNFGPGDFSFNQPGGRCETCEGQGAMTIDMQFLADMVVICPECQGTRFKKEILNVRIRSLSIAEVLNLTVREAFRFFRAQRQIEKRLKVLLDVGLDYLRLGQSLGTLSGGECQRLKLAGHLAAARKPRTLFLLLEPTSGLHMAEVAGLIDCLGRLIDTGHSVIVIEHNLEFIRHADHIIDLGPGAGPAGGRIVATGTPEAVAQVEESATGQCLRKYLT